MNAFIKERAVMRLLGIHSNADGTQWSAPRKHAQLIEDALERSREQLDEEGIHALLVRGDDGLELVTARRTVTVRWVG